MRREPCLPAHPTPAPRTAARVHRWLGGNTLIAAYYKYDEQAEKLVAFLKDGLAAAASSMSTSSLWRRKMTRQPAKISALVAPLGLTSFSLAAGETLVADVVIQNKGIAHSYVPEQRDFYESWVNFTVKDSAGKVISESGFIQPDGNLDPSAHSFTNRLINTKGELNGLHQIWHNRVLAYNNTIQSGRSQLVRYRFRLPKDISGPVSITATVKYRRFNQHFIDYAMDQTGQQHFPMPIIDVASQTRVLEDRREPACRSCCR